MRESGLVLEPHPNKEYNCCCNSMHSKRAARIIAWVCIVLDPIALVFVCFLGRSIFMTTFNVLFIALELVASVMLLKAHCTNKAIWVKPFLFLRIFSAIQSLLISIFCVLAACSPEGELAEFAKDYLIGSVYSNQIKQCSILMGVPLNMIYEILFAYLAVVYCVAVFFSIWICFVIRKFDRYLTDSSQHCEANICPAIVVAHPEENKLPL